MRENKKKRSGGYVSKHAAPEKQVKKPRRTEEEYQPSMIESVELPRMRKRREQEEAERAEREAMLAAGEDPDGYEEPEDEEAVRVALVLVSADRCALVYQAVYPQRLGDDQIDDAVQRMVDSMDVLGGSAAKDVG